MNLPLPSPEVVFCEVEDGAVLLSTTDELYFALNAVGARIWTLLPPTCQTVEQICDILQREYPGITGAQLRDDVEELLRELVREKLVKVA